MPYVGPQPKLGRNREVDDISSGFNGSTTAFTLQVSGSNVSPGTANDIVVSLGGVIQNPNQDFTIAGSTITFTTAPASGLSFFAVVLGQSIDSSVVTPADGSVTGTKLSNPLDLADNHKIRFGTNADSEVFHDGTDFFIREQDGGQLLFRADGNHVFTNSAGSEIRILTANNGGVDLYHNNVKKFETESGGVSLTGGAAANINVIASATSITIDMALACHHDITMSHNITFAAPSNQAVGQSGSIFLSQDSSGSRTASFNSAFKFVGGTAPTLSTAASAIDRIDYVIFASNVIHCAVSLDVK